MSNNKQSSVEWLIAEIQRRVSIIQSEPQTMARELMIDNLSVDLEQAKAMHKEEHGQTWDKSMENFEARGRNEMRAWVDFDEYYEETYESNT